MSQLILGASIDGKKDLTYIGELKILFQETKDILLPLMQQHILEGMFTPKHNSSYSETIKKHMLYLLNNKQYFERATFIKLGIVSLEANWEPYTSVLMGEEFLYISQMILDDIVDNQKTRMNQSTINDLIGNEKSLAIAEIFESEGYKLIYNGIANIPKEKQNMIMNKTFEMMKNIYYAQFIDISLKALEIDQVTIEDYLRFLQFTTPADIANCFFIGSAISGKDVGIAKQFYNFGLNLGMMMQLKDDFIDFLSEDIACKDTFLDIKNNNKRIPIILAYALSSPKEREFIQTVLGKENLKEEEKERIKSIIFSDKIMHKAQELNRNIKEHTSQILKQLPIKENFKELLQNILLSLEL